jgi:hypothetical protein
MGAAVHHQERERCGDDLPQRRARSHFQTHRVAIIGE